MVGSTFGVFVPYQTQSTLQRRIPICTGPIYDMAPPRRTAWLHRHRDTQSRKIMRRSCSPVNRKIWNVGLILLGKVTASEVVYLSLSYRYSLRSAFSDYHLFQLILFCGSCGIDHDEPSSSQLTYSIHHCVEYQEECRGSSHTLGPTMRMLLGMYFLRFRIFEARIWKLSIPILSLLDRTSRRKGRSIIQYRAWWI
jgi:hypothetical protein